jgi:prepilin-type N-terminal cleavage/methylation domain-containing protein
MKRAAFTLIEIMIVVAIISILVGAAFFGWHSVLRNANDTKTRLLLSTSRTILNEYATATKLASNISSWPWDAGTVDTATTNAGWGLNIMTAPMRYETDGSPGITASDTPSPMPAPDSTDTGSWQMTLTRQVLAQMRRLPACAKLMSSLSKEALESGTTGTTVPLLMDGYGNPILYCPFALGRLPSDATTTDRVSVGGVDTLVKSPDGKPFWVSAGPDGDFGNGDDNVYSFEN